MRASKHIGISSRRLCSNVVVAVGLLSICCGSAHAWNPFDTIKKLGQGVVDTVKGGLNLAGSIVGAPIGGLVDSATAPTIDHAKSAGHELIADLDGRMKDRILQVDDVLKKGIGELDTSLQNRLIQADDAMRKRIDQFDGAMAGRIEQINVVLATSIDRVDDVLGKRLDELDALSEKRIGNLDVVTTKAAYTFEGALNRFVLSACLTILIAVILYSIYRQAGASLGEEKVRSWKTWRAAILKTKWTWISQAALALMVVGVFYAIAVMIPGSPRAQAEALAQVHEKAFETSLEMLDLQRAQYYASQLVLLRPGDNKMRAWAIKAELLRDLLNRPTLLQTEQGIGEHLVRIQQCEQLLGNSVDPDICVAKAIISWLLGSIRQLEFEAANFCAQALADPNRQFALRPIAVNYLENYVHNPIPQDAIVKDAGSTSMSSFADLQKCLTDAKQSKSSKSSGSQLAYLADYDALVRDLDEKSTKAYIAMVDAHAAYMASKDPQKKADRKTRAKEVTDAWEAFGKGLRGCPTLIGTTAPLAAFMLNDATLVRAKWYFKNDSDADLVEDVAPTLVSAKGNRNDYTPFRVELSKTYDVIVPENARRLLETQEYKRYVDCESDAIEFEKRFIAFKKALVTANDPNDIIAKGHALADSSAKNGFVDFADSNHPPYADNILVVMREGGRDRSESQDQKDKIHNTVTTHLRVRTLKLL